MFERNEILFLYQLLDQTTVQGIPQKSMVVTIMMKLNELLQQPTVTQANVEAEKDSE